MISRQLESTLRSRITQSPVVALLGSRQVGKTTLAKGLALDKPVHYLDLERPSDLAKLTDPELYLGNFAHHLVILDEIQRVPDLFPVLRSLVDERRQAGERSGHFLILGSASPELLQQSSETLAGRITFLELTPLNLAELTPEGNVLDRHWFRGGYPESYLAVDDAGAMQWCDDFITSYVERYLLGFGITAAPPLLRRLCTMLAHQQGATLNLSRLAGSLGIDGKTVRHYIDLLEGLYLLRSVPAWSHNEGKRLVKAPKVYWRDTGLLHALAGLHDLEKVLGHPLCGHSWEGYCLEQIITRHSGNHRFTHYRTHAGAELDLVLETPDGRTVALEIKRTLAPTLSPGFLESMRTIKADQGFFIIPKGTAFPLADNTKAVSLAEFLTTIPEQGIAAAS